MKFLNLNIRKLIILSLLGVGLIPFIISISGITFFNADQFKQKEMDILQQSSDYAAAKIDFYFKSKMAHISHYANESRVKSMNWKEMDSYLQAEVKQNNKNSDSALQKVRSAIAKEKTILLGIESITNMMQELSNLTEKQNSANEEVNQGLKEVLTKTNFITSAIREGKVAIDEIVKSVSVISEMTQSNSLSSEEISASTEEISSMAETLKSEVSFFKIVK